MVAVADLHIIGSTTDLGRHLHSPSVLLINIICVTKCQTAPQLTAVYRLPITYPTSVLFGVHC